MDSPLYADLYLYFNLLKLVISLSNSNIQYINNTELTLAKKGMKYNKFKSPTPCSYLTIKTILEIIKFNTLNTNGLYKIDNHCTIDDSKFAKFITCRYLILINDNTKLTMLRKLIVLEVLKYFKWMNNGIGIR